MTILKGADISAYQTFTPPMDGLDFVFVRATWSLTGDLRWAQHSADVRAAGKVLGAYHFWYDGSTGASQAAKFLAVAGGADLLALDYEGAAVDVAGAKAFIAAIHAAGRKCGLYHSQSGFPNFGQDWNWVARWGTLAPTIPWTFWQNADTYLGSGAGGDSDRFNGDTTALNSLVDLPTGGLNQESDVSAFASNINPKLIDAGGAPLYDADGKTLIGAKAPTIVGAFSPGSPKGFPNLRLFWRSYQLGVWQLVSTAPIKVYDAPVPADTTPFSQADVDAKVAAAVASANLALNAAIAKITKAKADLA